MVYSNEKHYVFFLIQFTAWSCESDFPVCTENTAKGGVSGKSWKFGLGWGGGMGGHGGEIPLMFFFFDDDDDGLSPINSEST